MTRSSTRLVVRVRPQRVGLIPVLGRMKTLISAATIFAWAFSGPAIASPCLHYGPPSVKVVGRITREAFPASSLPSTAASELVYSWYFDTLLPICIAALPVGMGNAAFTDAQHFQILPPSDRSDLANFVGREVTLKGEFVYTRLPHPHQLTFSVESVVDRAAP
jgi:hypothetical protein